jgi:hypothetical protein
MENTNTLFENFKNGWVLTIWRESINSKNKWFFLPIEEVNKFSENSDISTLSTLKFKEARELLQVSQIVQNSELLNDIGLPLYSVYIHKDIK